MIQKNYSWRIDFYSVDANEVGKELEEIENSTGLTAENLVEYAKENEKSIVHGMLEWDDAVAGEKYRKSQAQRIITNIQVEIIKKEEKLPVRAFVKTTKAHNEEFRNIESVVSDAEKYQMLLSKAYAELNATKNRYKELEEIQELLKDIPEIN